MTTNTNKASGTSLFDPKIVGPAFVAAFGKLNPLALWRNPVVFAIEVIAAYVTILFARDGARLDEPLLRDFLKDRLAAFKVPARMIFSEVALPRLGTGKIDRVTLKQQLAG